MAARVNDEICKCGHNRSQHSQEIDQDGHCMASGSAVGGRCGCRRFAFSNLKANHVEISLYIGHARNLRDILGSRPHSEKWSKVVYDEITNVIQRRVNEL